MRRTVLHLGDPGVRVGRAFPVGVRQRLALALAVEARQVLGARRLDPALLRHPRQHRAVALACVAANDRAQRRVGFHRRAVDADPLALHQAALGHELQHPAEHLLVRLVRQTRARARKPRMIGNLLDVRQPQELAQRIASPRTATRCPARCRGPRNSRSCASGSTGPAAATERPSAARSTACTPPPRTRRSPPRRAAPATDRRTRAPASAASPPMSPSGHPAQRLIVPSPSLIRPQAQQRTESAATRLRQRAARRAIAPRAIAAICPNEPVAIITTAIAASAIAARDRSGVRVRVIPHTACATTATATSLRPCRNASASGPVNAAAPSEGEYDEGRRRGKSEPRRQPAKKTVAAQNPKRKSDLT